MEKRRAATWSSSYIWRNWCCSYYESRPPRSSNARHSGKENKKKLRVNEYNQKKTFSFPFCYIEFTHFHLKLFFFHSHHDENNIQKFSIDDVSYNAEKSWCDRYIFPCYVWKTKIVGKEEDHHHFSFIIAVCL